MKILGSIFSIIGFLAYFIGMFLIIFQTKEVGTYIVQVYWLIGIGAGMVIIGIIILCSFTDYFKNGFTELLKEEDLFHERDTE